MIWVRGLEIDNKNRSITHAGFIVRGIANVRWRYLMCLILGGGMTADEICDIVYANDPAGGPDGQRKYVAESMFTIPNKQVYARLGLKMVATRSNESKTRYELVPLLYKRGSR